MESQECSIVKLVTCKSQTAHNAVTTKTEELSERATPVHYFLAWEK